MKKSSESKKLNIDRVEEDIDNGKFIEFNEKVQKRPPQPLTREQLEYYHKAREQALKRKAKPVSVNNNIKNNSHQAYRRPVNKGNDSSQVLQEGSNNKSYNQSAHKSNSKTQNSFDEGYDRSNRRSTPNSKNSKSDKAARREEHLRKQAYYDSKYADDDEIVEYYAYSQEDSRPRNRKQKRFMHRLLRFISWLIFFLIFIIIGYFLAKLILS